MFSIVVGMYSYERKA